MSLRDQMHYDSLYTIYTHVVYVRLTRLGNSVLCTEKENTRGSIRVVISAVNKYLGIILNFIEPFMIIFSVFVH